MTTVIGNLSKHDVDGTENWKSGNVTSRLCHNFSFIQVMLEKCVLTILELNWNQRFGDKKTKLNICHHMLTSSTQLQNGSFQVVERTRTSSKYPKMKNARAKRAKKYCFPMSNEYTNLWGFFIKWTVRDSRTKSLTASLRWSKLISEANFQRRTNQKGLILHSFFGISSYRNLKRTFIFRGWSMNCSNIIRLISHLHYLHYEVALWALPPQRPRRVLWKHQLDLLHLWIHQNPCQIS